jgi:hypothetical protein
MIDYHVVRLSLRTAATNGPIVHPPGDMWAWSAMVLMVPAGNNSWLVRQSSLAVLLAKTSRASSRNGQRSDIFAYSVLRYLKGSLTCRKILRRGNFGFTSHPKEGVLRMFIALKNPSPRPGLNTRPLGPVTSTLTTTPPRRLTYLYLLIVKLELSPALFCCSRRGLYSCTCRHRSIHPASFLEFQCCQITNSIVLCCIVLYCKITY